MNTENQITALVEKPEEFVSDLAVIGIYYFKEGAVIKAALEKTMEEERAPWRRVLVE